MNITIREMQKDEVSLAWKTGRPSFSPVERLAFQKPKQAFLAFSDDEIVGMASYQIFPAKNNHKIGYVETGYVKKGLEGNGIGSALYQKATIFLKEQGCETVTATVRDDNIASWKLFQNNGYHVIGFLQMLQQYGLPGAIRLWFKSTLAIATGFHLWSTAPYKDSGTPHQLAVFAFLNLLILLSIFLFQGSAADFVFITAATACLLTAALLGGLIFTLFSKEKWHFRVTRGGLLVSVLLVATGTIWPVVGRFYPLEYKRTTAFRRSMGFEGLFEWLALLLVVSMAAVAKDQSLFLNDLVSLGATFLLFHSLPLYPFECFGGRRIWNYHKGLSTLTMIISAVLLFLF